ncbi:MAG TPA: hypothetical protein DEP51_05565 [Clostridiales bacterium]|nr:hypothetical protein [Clostridiales bacterium]
MKFRDYVSILKRKIQTKENVVYVCIGSSRFLWDSVGPFVGSFLKEKMSNKLIIGDMNNNICDKKDLLFYYPKLKNKYIVAIDAAINNELKNDIYVNNNYIAMGTAFNYNKGNIGNVCIKAGISNWQTITLSEVKDISQFIARGILNCELYS